MVGVNRKQAPNRTDWRKKAKERDNYKCRVCGFAEIIHSHHILPKAKGGKHALDNLITLCPNHHAMVHAGMISDTELKAAIEKPLATQSELRLTRVLNFRR